MPRKTKFSADEIVAAAFDLVRRSGWAGLTTAHLAEQIGCSTMPIYSYFKNLEDLSNAVLEQCWAKLMRYEAMVITGDVWLDQAIGYVFFARDEKQLFRCMNDSKHLEKQGEMRQKNWDYLSGLLVDYPLFAGLEGEVLDQIRYSRVMMTHGLASMVNIGWHPEMQKNENIIKYISLGSKALLKGIIQQSASGKD